MTLDHLEALAAPYFVSVLATYRVTYKTMKWRVRTTIVEASDSLDACDVAVQDLLIDYAAITRVEVV